jgi:predicted DNA binding CopG/RHH family protein
MKNYKMTDDENELATEALSALESGDVEMLSIVPKTKPISIKMDSMDLELIKETAMKEGMPYQTWIKSTLHKVLTGQLVRAQ